MEKPKKRGFMGLFKVFFSLFRKTNSPSAQSKIRQVRRVVRTSPYLRTKASTWPAGSVECAFTSRAALPAPRWCNSKMRRLAFACVAMSIPSATAGCGGRVTQSLWSRSCSTAGGSTSVSLQVPSSLARRIPGGGATPHHSVHRAPTGNISCSGQRGHKTG